MISVEIGLGLALRLVAIHASSRIYVRESTIDDQRESHSEHRVSRYDCRSIVHPRVRRFLRAVPYMKKHSEVVDIITVTYYFQKVT